MVIQHKSNKSSLFTCLWTWGTVYINLIWSFGEHSMNAPEGLKVPRAVVGYHCLWQPQIKKGLKLANFDYNSLSM